MNLDHETHFMLDLLGSSSSCLASRPFVEVHVVTMTRKIRYVSQA